MRQPPTPVPVHLLFAGQDAPSNGDGAAPAAQPSGAEAEAEAQAQAHADAARVADRPVPADASVDAFGAWLRDQWRAVSLSKTMIPAEDGPRQAQARSHRLWRDGLTWVTTHCVPTSPETFRETKKALVRLTQYPAPVEAIEAIAQLVAQWDALGEHGQIAAEWLVEEVAKHLPAPHAHQQPSGPGIRARAALLRRFPHLLKGDVATFWVSIAAEEADGETVTWLWPDGPPPGPGLLMLVIRVLSQRDRTWRTPVPLAPWVRAMLDPNTPSQHAALIAPQLASWNNWGPLDDEALVRALLLHPDRDVRLLGVRHARLTGPLNSPSRSGLAAGEDPAERSAPPAIAPSPTAPLAEEA